MLDPLVVKSVDPLEAMAWSLARPVLLSRHLGLWVLTRSTTSECSDWSLCDDEIDLGTPPPPRSKLSFVDPSATNVTILFAESFTNTSLLQ